MSMTRAQRAGEIVASHSREQLVDALLENLSIALTDGRGAAPDIALLRRFDDGYEQRIAAWPRVSVASSASPEQVSYEVPNFGVLRIFATPRRAARHRRLVDETITWLGAIMHATPPRRRLDKARHDASRAQTAVEAFELRIARARESEHMRLVESLTTDTARDLEDVRAQLSSSEVSWSSVSSAMSAIIQDFRTIVRGVFPAMLPERGAAETLREIAAGLPVAVEFRGDLGRRAGWEIESSFTQTVASVLSAVSISCRSVQLVFERDGALRARVKSAGSGDVTVLAAALSADRERIEALGGALAITSTAGAGFEIVVTVSDHSEVSWLPLSRSQLSSRPVHVRVTALLESARLSEDEIAPWRAELFAPIRLLVVKKALPTLMPGVEAVLCESEPDRLLAEQLRDPFGPWGTIDAVVCADPHDAEFVSRLSDGVLLFSRETPVADAVASLSARAPVIAARRALNRIADYARRHPDSVGLRWQVDHLTAGSHELVEDRLLDELARGDAPSVVDDQAARLLGLYGGDRCVRLGLDEEASEPIIEAELDARLERWRSIVNGTELDAASRAAAEVVLGSATRLLMG